MASEPFQEKGDHPSPAALVSTPGAGTCPNSSPRETPDVHIDSKAQQELEHVMPEPQQDALQEPQGSQDPYGHLTPEQADILRRQVDVPELQHGLNAIYRYATRADIIIMVVSSVCAAASGAAMPLMNLVFGSFQSTFQNYAENFDGNLEQLHRDFDHVMVQLVLYFIYLAIGQFVASYVATLGFIYTGEHITAKIRRQYLKSCLRQNIGFYDNIGAGEVTTRITADTNLIQDGISQKVSLSITAITTFVAAFIVSFVNYWKLTLILSGTVFALIFTVGAGSSFMLKNNIASLQAYSKSGGLAEEIITSIRSAIAFGTQDRLVNRYAKYLDSGTLYGYKMQRSLAVMVSFMWLILFLSYGLAFWQGSKYVVDGIIPLSKLLVITMSVMIGAFALVNVMPYIQAFITAIAAVSKIANTIDRQSPLDPTSGDGEKLHQVHGDLRLENVQHFYPSRPEVVVMDNVSLDIPAGKTTALVGASGSGKSTIVGLIERFYEPVGGTIYLDGHDISKLNLRWLRQQVSLVSQEPTLFATSVYQNIRYGLIGTLAEKEDEQTQRELVIEAAKKANAHDFVSCLPQGYETSVGEKGFLLSGGQKQRIAIARAIVSDPKILLLDEATSALDTKSEGVVQAALEAAAAGRTTISIAHRLSTVKNASNIVVMSEGRIVEQGTHQQLLDRKGPYFNLVSAQKFTDSKTLTAEEEELMDVEDEKILLRKVSARARGAAGGSSHRMMGQTTAITAQDMALDLGNDALDGEEDPKYSLWTLINLIRSLNQPEWKIMLVGLVFSIICGAGNPLLAVFFAEQILVLSRPLTDDATRSQVKKGSDFWSAMFLMLAFVQLIAYALSGVAFAMCSERLIRRVRERALRAILRQDVAFFDRDENSSGALTAFLSTETTHVSGLSGATLGTILMMATTLVAAIAISLAVGWKLSLVCVSTMPILLACGFYRFWLLAHFQSRSKAAYVASASFASEAVSSIRTVAALGREDGVLAEYDEALAAQQRNSLKSVLKSTALFATSQSLVFLCLALGFWYGSTLIGDGEYSQFQFFLCLTAVIFGSESAGSIFSFAPDMSNAHRAASALKALFDRKPTIDPWSAEGDRLDKVEGAIQFHDVYFRYPARPQQSVLRGLDLSIEPGQYVALVGSSGCGKSTAIGLLERFYDPLAGEIYVDGKDISTLNISNYRSFIALVSQEPTLYQGTIRDNIVLGAGEDDDVPDDEAIESACRKANIYDFILSLPEGFDTVVGSKGVLLSGGQKQRIAIARALIRDPKILLLDEATSALDSESEQVVQAALDAAAKGRTTIAVAHRLSTIQKADRIYVLDSGRVVEQGTHADLMSKGGRYAELVNLQSLGKQG